MNASQLLQDLDCMTEVSQAACVYDDNARGQRVRQSFYIAPNDTIYSLSICDGNNTVLTLSGDDEAIFRNRHPEYFQ